MEDGWHRPRYDSPNPPWDEIFRRSRAPNVLETKPKLRKFRYDGTMEIIETLYSTTYDDTVSIGLHVHTIEKWKEERESTGMIPGNVVGFWDEVRKYSSHIEALMEKDNQLRLSPILAQFRKLDEPLTEEKRTRTFQSGKIVDMGGRRLYEKSNQSNPY